MRDALARYYDADWAPDAAGDAAAPALIAPVRRPATRHQACVSLFPRFFRGGHVLELGAGGGRIARSLAAAGLAFESYTLGEVSRPRLAALERSFAGEARIRVAELDAESLPEDASACFDAVLLVAVIEHLVDPLHALRSIRRLLRPGGCVYLDTPNAAKYSRRLKLLFGRFPSTASLDEGLTRYDGAPVDLHDEGHLHYFTYRSLSLLLHRCGFSRVERLAYASPPFPFGTRVGHALARLRPQLFSEVCVVAFA